MFLLLIVPLAIEAYGRFAIFSVFLLPMCFGEIMPSTLEPLFDWIVYCLMLGGIKPPKDLSPEELGP